MIERSEKIDPCHMNILFVKPMVPYEGITGDRESENKSYWRLHLKRTALRLFVNTSINGKRLITHVIHLFNAFSIHRVRTCQEE